MSSLLAGLASFLSWNTIGTAGKYRPKSQVRKVCGATSELAYRFNADTAERALHIAERKKLYVEMHPETKNGAIGNGRKKLRQLGEATSEPADRFTADTAEKTGSSERNIQRDACRGEKIPRLKEIIGTALSARTRRYVRPANRQGVRFSATL